jgi:integrase
MTRGRRKRGMRGAGTVFLRADGRWEAKFKVEETGKFKSLYGKTEKEAYEKLQKALQEQKQGILATGPQQKVGDFLNRWLEEVQHPKIEDSTYVTYRTYLDVHVLPALGHIQLQKLTPQHVQSFYTRLPKEGLALSTVKNIHSLLHGALDNAVRWNLVSRNVCDIVSPPSSEKHEARFLTPDEARRLLEAVKGHRLEALITLALATGMRRGELLGLRWQDIDLEKHRLQVRRSMRRLGRGYGVKASGGKTPKSRRLIVLPNFVVKVLIQHRELQVAARQLKGDAWEENGLVFPNGYGRFLDQGQLHVMFHKVLKKAGLPDIRFHELRHSAASFLLSMGVHPKVVQEIPGHSTISMTLDTYSHVLPSMQQEAMDKMDDFFKET